VAYVSPRIGRKYQAAIPDFGHKSAASVLRLPPQVAVGRAPRSWQPLWMRGTHLSHSDKGASGNSCWTSLLDSYTVKASRSSTDWRVGMRVGVPRPQNSGVSSSLSSPSLRIEPGVLLSWRFGDVELVDNPAVASPIVSVPGQSLLTSSPPVGTAFVAVLSSAVLLQVPLFALRVQNSDLFVCHEVALEILMHTKGSVPAALAEVEKRTSKKRLQLLQSPDRLFSQARAERLTLANSMKLLAGCAEIAVLPHTPLVAPLISGVYAADAVASLQGWTYLQQMSFAYNYNRHGKMFNHFFVPNRSVSDCVSYYYRHKHNRMCVTGIGFSSRNPCVSRWKTLPGLAPHAAADDRNVVRDFGWKCDDSGSEKFNSDDGNACVSDPSILQAATVGEVRHRLARPIVPPARDGASGNGLIPVDRVSHLQLAAAMTAFGDPISDVLALLRRFQLLHFDKAKEQELHVADLELGALRQSQRPASALDPLNSKPACSGCSKFSSSALVCCNPKCGVVSCETCFRVQVRVMRLLM
jgi:hypothetical protein